MPTKPYNSPTYWQPFTKTHETSQWVMGLDEQFKQAAHRETLDLPMEAGTLEICLTANSLWLISEWGGAGKLAIRTCFDPQLVQKFKKVRTTKNGVEYQIQGSLGTFGVKIECPHSDKTLLHYTTSLKPAQPFTVQAFPRDLYLLDNDYNPFTTEGMVYVTQSGPTSGLAYLSLVEPTECSVFYFQNFTALSDYCQMTQTEPSSTVTVQWPEVGFALPSSNQPLEAGQEIVLSDAYIYLIPTVPKTEFQAADQFLEAIGRVYRLLPKPETEYYDWPKAAEITIEALTESPHCGRRIQKHYYVNAYVDSTQKPPESMVQLAILVPLWEYQEWLGQTVSLVEQLQKNLPSFYDEKHETIMRWLPGGIFKEEERSEEQDHNKVDSWYLLHTLLNLGRLAEKGNPEAKDLLFGSLEYVIKAGHHFNYDWPVFYDIRTLDIIKAETAEGQGGELDVAGLYTHVMVQAYELTRDPRYLNEAMASAERLKGKGFELLYQSNITIMSALTLAKLWKITGNRLYFDQSRLSIANVLARLWIWECNFGYGQNRSIFMGVAPLKNAPYVAAYEEAEIFATMLSFLKEVGPDVPETVRMMFSEYFKYLLHRGRFYFPSELPEEMVCQQPREGRLIRELPIPLEDISIGWKQAGEVGQEVYGGAMPYILTTNAYKQFQNIPVIIFSDYPIYHAEYEFTEKNKGYVVVRLAGTSDCTCQVRLIAKSRSMPTVQLYDEDAPDSPALEPVKKADRYCEYRVSGSQRLRMEWESAKKN
ncbi:hypothetical protein ACFQ4C_01705 [Larkinella insperata]|uniref:Uncharacterized protein n=1 Tax=Larkinella insperata TaxID=332158 RepID=A0ABW3QDZ2_9BACT|nr:hypothetical protein [Larkinella insperata]